jgi:hypothetical protein
MERKHKLRLVGLAVGTAAALGGAAVSRAHTRAVPDDPAATRAERAMLWKYVARCALPAGQSLAAPGGETFPGLLGVAPEWRDGACDAACQEKVSACLFALTNPTGKHVEVSLLSSAPGFPAGMAPSQSDLPYPFQEGAFFGNVFAGEAYVCRGRDAAAKGAQVKRWCAIDPSLCSGLATFADAGSCDDACEMSCASLSDGSRRCAAARCRDPRGRTWSQPITTYLRDRIEAGNADAVERARERDNALEGFAEGASARYRYVDFGGAPGGERALVARVTAPRAAGRIEVWLAGGPRLGTAEIAATGGSDRDVTVPLGAAASALSGPQDLLLKFAGLDREARVIDVRLR